MTKMEGISLKKDLVKLRANFETPVALFKSVNTALAAMDHIKCLVLPSFAIKQWDIVVDPRVQFSVVFEIPNHKCVDDIINPLKALAGYEVFELFESCFLQNTNSVSHLSYDNPLTTGMKQADDGASDRTLI